MAVPTLRRATQPRPEAEPPTPRPRAWREFLLVAVLYMAYDGTRLVAEGGDTKADRHGRALLRAERFLRLDWERWLNKTFAAHASLAIAGDYLYAVMHYAVTPVVLIWLFRRHPATYLRARTVLAFATIIALLGYWLLPTAPPRMIGAGFVDTMSRHANGHGRHDQRGRRVPVHARRLGPVVRVLRVPLRRPPLDPRARCRLSDRDGDRRDGHRQPLPARRPRRLRRRDRRRPDRPDDQHPPNDRPLAQRASTSG
jgi:PAP2 superfamily